MSRRERIRKWGAAILILTVLLVAAGCGGTKTVAEVNGEKITRAQLDTYMNILRLFMPQLEPMLGDRSRRAVLEKQILDTMIDNVLIKQGAARQGVTVTDDDVESVYLQARVQMVMMFGGSEEELNRKMAELKISEQDLKEFIGSSAYADRLYEFFVAEMTDEQIREFLDKNPALAQVPEMIEVSHILFDSEEEALAARERLLAGEDFGDLAVELSTDPSAQLNRGYLDKIPAGSRDYDPDFMAGASMLAAGEISQPVESQFGWHLILLHNRHEATQLSFEEIRDRAAEEAAGEKFDAYFAMLRSQAVIKNRL